MKINVVGTGYVGLSLTELLARHHAVVGEQTACGQASADLLGKASRKTGVPVLKDYGRIYGLKPVVLALRACLKQQANLGGEGVKPALVNRV